MSESPSIRDSRPPHDIPKSERRWVAAAVLIVVLLSSLPYLAVALTTPADLRFGGALVNPIDGQSYLAKLRQGYDGFWLFRLPYTASSEPAAVLFTFHLALGHIARLTGAPLTVVYHLARVAGGWWLLVVVYRLIARVFDAASERRWAWLFVAVSSGLGWLGVASTDLTIPESNTFFSLLTNAHFAAATALMIMFFMAVLDGSAWRAALAALGLAILQPFAPIAVFAAALAGWLIGRWGRAEHAFSPRQLVAIVAAGVFIAPLIAYFYFATQRDPVLQGWSAQNTTPSPPVSEYLFGYGLMWLLAIPGAWSALRTRRGVDVLLVAWAVTSALLLYAPFALQRRFSLGLHIPLVLLGVMGLLRVVVPRLQGRLARWLPRLVWLVSLPSTLLLLIATSTAALRTPDPRLFFSAHEAAGFDWLRDHAPHESVVVAAPSTGLFLPAWADVRVIYGHPFETVDAEAAQALVERFLAGSVDRSAAAVEHGIDYVFFGPREAAFGDPAPDWAAVFQSGDVTIYRLP